VDETFEVKESNVKMEEGKPRVLGNVLHCKHSHDTGRCGEGEVCRRCPVRFVISKSFERHDDFRKLEACMELDGDAHGHTNDVDVSVDGSFVTIDKVPHMVVNVKNITTLDGTQLPKVLFISESTALYDKVRQALGVSYRVLNADTQHQALHRLMRAANYQFCAVITDASVYHADTVLATILAERKEQLPVFVFAGKKERKDDRVNYLDADIAPEELFQCVAMQAQKTTKTQQ
jgi:aerobic-type carbon monoxide dehydrogenase small subunit (CoxS/CutS family)